MKKKNNVLLISLMFSIFCLPAFFGFTRPVENEETLEREKIEKYLKNARIIHIDDETQSGRTSAWDITLDDGQVKRKARFKYVNRHRPRIPPDSYQYELAAYELNKLLELDIVPPVIQRTIEDMEGSLSVFVEDCIPETERKALQLEPPDAQCRKQMDIVIVFENLVAEVKHSLSDILIDCEKWKVWRVDFSEAFEIRNSLMDSNPITCCSKSLYQNLLKLEKNELEERLKPWLNQPEIDSLWFRKQLITDTLGKLIAEKGQDTVLFDLHK
ncbi:hypothetical protein ACFLT9_11210 [Acidobacteriota bacterium]